MPLAFDLGANGMGMKPHIAASEYVKNIKPLWHCQYTEEKSILLRTFLQNSAEWVKLPTLHFPILTL